MLSCAGTLSWRYTLKADEEQTGLRGSLLRLVGRNVRRAREGVILKSATNKGGLP
jgi:hypothetical protein